MSRRAEVFKDNAGEIRWRLVAENGQVISTSGEGYKNRVHAHKMIHRIILPPYHIVDLTDREGEIISEDIFKPSDPEATPVNAEPVLDGEPQDWKRKPLVQGEPEDA